MHRTVDDAPYGGGPGMVMKVEPCARRLPRHGRHILEAKVVYTSPQGRRLDQAGVAELAARETLILLAGRYEGVDERVIERDVDEEWSIGDYVLSGGELAAMVIIDAVARLRPGVLGHEGSAEATPSRRASSTTRTTRGPRRWTDSVCRRCCSPATTAEFGEWRLEQALARTRTQAPRSDRGAGAERRRAAFAR